MAGKIEDKGNFIPVGEKYRTGISKDVPGGRVHNGRLYFRNADKADKDEGIIAYSGILGWLASFFGLAKRYAFARYNTAGQITDREVHYISYGDATRYKNYKNSKVEIHDDTLYDDIAKIYIETVENKRL